MSPLFKHRIHEPVALASVVATAAALHATWISNLIYFRQARVDTLGALYLFVGCVFLIAFVLTLAWCRGRDCAWLRARAFHALSVAIGVFLVMSFPLVYGFQI